MTPITRLHGNLVAARAFFRLVRDPRDLDPVFEMIRGMQQPQFLDEMLSGVGADPQGASALIDRPRVGRLELEALRALPEGSLGRAFADFIDREGIDPGDLPSAEAANEGDYIPAHLYETHDLWHLVTGFETDVAGELGLQAFYLAQVPGRVASLILAAGMLNTMLRDWDDRGRRMDAIVRGWQLGQQARPLFGLRWAERWEIPLEELREEYRLVA